MYAKVILKIIFLFFVGVLNLNAQNKDIRHEIPPAWVSRENPPKLNDSYEFHYIGNIESTSIAKAKDEAWKTLIFQLASEQKVFIDGESLIKMKTMRKNGDVDEIGMFIYTYNIKYEKFSASFKLLDSYWEKSYGKYTYHALYAVAINPDDYKFEPINYTTNYGVSATLRSAVWPGIGQLYKKQKAKGVSLIIAEVLLVSGALLSNNQYNFNYNEAIKNIKHPSTYYYYIDKADVWKSTRNMAFIGAAAIYVYNVVDAIATKGAKRYAYSKPRKYYIYPNYNNSFYCLNATINF